MQTQTEAQDDVNRDCAICLLPMSDVGRTVTLDSCKHTFHGECIVRSLQFSQRCPLCRTSELDLYKEKMREYRRYLKLKQEVLDSPELLDVRRCRANTDRDWKLNESKLRHLMRDHGHIYRTIRRVLDKRDELRECKWWCKTRIRAELLKRNVPPNMSRPKPSIN